MLLLAYCSVPSADQGTTVQNPDTADLKAVDAALKDAEAASAE